MKKYGALMGALVLIGVSGGIASAQSQGESFRSDQRRMGDHGRGVPEVLQAQSDPTTMDARRKRDGNRNGNNDAQAGADRRNLELNDIQDDPNDPANKKKGDGDRRNRDLNDLQRDGGNPANRDAGNRDRGNRDRGNQDQGDSNQGNANQGGNDRGKRGRGANDQGNQDQGNRAAGGGDRGRGGNDHPGGDNKDALNKALGQVLRQMQQGERGRDHDRVRIHRRAPLDRGYPYRRGAYEWQDLGCQSVGFLTDRDVIRVGRREGRFSAIRLHVYGNSVYLHDLRIVYGNGEPDRIRLRTELRVGRATPPLDLSRGDRFIDRIELVYQAKPNFRGKAKVCVSGLGADDDWIYGRGPRR